MTYHVIQIGPAEADRAFPLVAFAADSLSLAAWRDAASLVRQVAARLVPNGCGSFETPPDESRGSLLASWEMIRLTGACWTSRYSSLPVLRMRAACGLLL
jgi:hypothetical protein